MHFPITCTRQSLWYNYYSSISAQAYFHKSPILCTGVLFPDGERPYSSWDPQQHLQDCPNCYETTKSLPGAYNPPLSLLIGYSCPLGGQRAIINCGLPHGTGRVSYHNIQRKHDLRICIIAHRKLFRLEAGPASHNPGWTDWQSPSHRHHNINICNGRKVSEGSLAIHTGCHDHFYWSIHLHGLSPI